MLHKCSQLVVVECGAERGHPGRLAVHNGLLDVEIGARGLKTVIGKVSRSGATVGKRQPTRPLRSVAARARGREKGAPFR